MTKRFIIYISLLALTVYLSLLYDGVTIRFLIAFEIILPVIMLAMITVQRMFVEVVLEIPSVSIGKNDDITVELKVKQNNILIQKLFPVHGIIIKGKCTDSSNSVKPVRKYFDLHYDENQRQRIVFAGMTQHYGVVSFSIDKVQIYDYMKMFAFKVPMQYRNEVYIMPQSNSSAVDVSSLKTDSNTGIGDMIASSLDNSRENVIELREYREGDHIKSIHWKVSARMDELMVREYDGLTSAKLFVLVDGINTEDKDRWIEKVFFICKSLSQEILEYDIGWLYDGKYIKYRIDKAEGFIAAMHMFLKAQQEGTIQSTKNSRNKAYATGSLLKNEYSTILSIDIKGRIRMNGEELA